MWLIMRVLFWNMPALQQIALLKIFRFARSVHFVPIHNRPLILQNIGSGILKIAYLMTSLMCDGVLSYLHALKDKAWWCPQNKNPIFRFPFTIWFAWRCYTKLSTCQELQHLNYQDSLTDVSKHANIQTHAFSFICTKYKCTWSWKQTLVNR